MPRNRYPLESELAQMSARFAPARIVADTSRLSVGDRAALKKILAAARVMDGLYLKQLWRGNQALQAKLAAGRKTSKLAQARHDYFEINKGPWSSLDGQRSFLPGVPARKPLGAHFYPEDMTREEFEAWPEKSTGFFSVVRREPHTRRLMDVPYRVEYRSELTKAAKFLREAAALTPNQSLRRFCQLRADAFLLDDYYASDIAWLELDSPIDLTIGPYETYTDELFGYKAAFEAYVAIRDARESKKLKFFADHLQEIEDNLPLDARFKNPKLGATVPIAVVNLLSAHGDGAHGVMTAAFNLPNDERVVREKGTKQVMMKNVQRAKFDSVLVPVATELLDAGVRKEVRFDSFFTHILAHELSHGIGPHDNVRSSLKEIYSAIEEAKADLGGLFLLQYLFDKGLLPRAERALYATYLASAFRTLRFGIEEAHGKGMAIQFNYLLDRGAFVLDAASGRYSVDFTRMADAVRGLLGEILSIEAKGDYESGRKLIARYSSIGPPLRQALDRLRGIPVDIRPIYGRYS